MKKNEYIKRAVLESAMGTEENAILLDLTAEGEEYPDVEGGRWFSDEELSKLEEVGWPVAERNGKTLLVRMAHTLVLGSTGRGKSTVAYQNMVRVFSMMKRPPSIFMTDIKGDCSPILIPLLAKTHDIYVFNCMNPSISETYNSLLSIYDNYHEAQKIKCDLDADAIDLTFEGKTYPDKQHARSMANEKRNKLLDQMEESIGTIVNIIITTTDPKNLVWDNGGRSMLRAIIRAALYYSEDECYGISREKFHIGTIAQIARSVQNECEPLIEFLRQVGQPEIEQTVSATYQLHAKQTRDSYVATLCTNLSRYVSRCIQILSHSSTIDLDKIATSPNPVAIFIITDDSRQNTIEYSAMFFQTLVQKLKNTADSSPRHCLERDHIFLLDEAANCSSMLSGNISSMISALRSRRIWLALGVQTLDQLRALYGERVATTIVDNSALMLFFGSNNRSCKEWFSSEMGRHQVERETYNMTPDSISKSIHSETIPLVPVSQLEQLKLGEFFVIHEKLQNVRLKATMTPFFARNDIDHEVADLREYGNYDRDFFDPDENFIDIEKIVELWKERHEPPARKNSRWGDYFNRFHDDDTKEEDSIVCCEDEDEVQDDEKMQNQEGDEDKDSETPSDFQDMDFDSAFKEFMRRVQDKP